MKEQNKKDFFEGVEFFSKDSVGKSYKCAVKAISKLAGSDKKGAKIFSLAMGVPIIAVPLAATFAMTGVAVASPILLGVGYTVMTASIAGVVGVTAALHVVSGFKSLIDAKKAKKSKAFLSGVFATATVYSSILTLGAGVGVHGFKNMVDASKRNGFVSASEELMKAIRGSKGQEEKKEDNKNVNPLMMNSNKMNIL